MTDPETRTGDAAGDPKTTRTGSASIPAKPQPKRLSKKRQSRLALVSKHYLQGITDQWKLAGLCDCSQSDIKDDLKILREQWRESYVEDVNSIVIGELAKLSHIESELLAAWELSKADTTITTVHNEQVPCPINKGQFVEKKSVSKQVRSGAGDPRYLDGAVKVISAKAKLLGSEAPIKLLPMMGDGKGGYTPMSITNMTDAQMIDLIESSGRTVDGILATANRQPGTTRRSGAPPSGVDVGAAPPSPAELSRLLAGSPDGLHHELAPPDDLPGVRPVGGGGYSELDDLLPAPDGEE